MTNTKAQVGDLIRITEVVSYSVLKSGEIYEVEGVDGDGDVTFKHKDGSDCYASDGEYVIHRKAGEEDSCDNCGKQGVHTCRGEEYHASLHEGESVVPAQSDAVNSPQHYTQGRVEVIDIIEDAVEGADPFEAVCQANILKYTLRYRAKNGVEDLKKAQWYMSRLITHLDEMF